MSKSSEMAISAKLYSALKRLMTRPLSEESVAMAFAVIDSVEDREPFQRCPDGWTFLGDRWERRGSELTIHVAANGQFWCPITGMQSWDLADCIESAADYEQQLAE